MREATALLCCLTTVCKHLKSLTVVFLIFFLWLHATLGLEIQACPEAFKALGQAAVLHHPTHHSRSKNHHLAQLQRMNQTPMLIRAV